MHKNVENTFFKYSNKILFKFKGNLIDIEKKERKKKKNLVNLFNNR